MTVLQTIRGLLTQSQRRRAFVLLALMILGMVLETLGIGLVVPAVALLLQQDLLVHYRWLRPVLSALGDPTQRQLATAGMLTLVAIFLIKAAFLGYLAWRQTGFAFDVQADLSDRLFTMYLRQPYAFHLQRNSAELIRNAITEVNQFTAACMLPALLLMTEGLVLIGIASLLVVVEPLGTLIIAVVLGSATAAFHRGTRSYISRWGEARQYHEGFRIQHLQEGLGGVKDVKLLGREREFLAQYRGHNLENARVSQYQITLQQLPRLWLEVLAVAGLACLVLTMIAQGRSMVSIVPTLGLFAAAAFRVMPSVNRALGAVQSLRYGLPVIRVLHEELRIGAPDSVTAEVPNQSPLGDFKAEVRLADVSYTYPAAPAPALNGLSLTIQKGQTVGFVGPSGSGKTTLVDIILGLLTPDAGQVVVDGVDIQFHLRRWQNQIGYVPQTIYLTDDTLRRNVAFGLPREEINASAVARAIAAAQLEDFIDSLPQGLDTVVGERGVRLSGGQRQRIGIARALYHDPGVLVLDEASSALDTATEKSLMQAVAALHGVKTILIVAHRLSTLEHCDWVYRFDQGRVAEGGRPIEMLRTKRWS